MTFQRISYIIFALFFGQWVQAQTLDEETGFIYVKAEYLFETGRMDEAITQFNAVIAKNPKFKEALIHRGQAKFALAAYKGAKMDAMQSIDLKGIEAESAALLGRANSAMNDIPAAIGSLNAAICLDNTNANYYIWRASIYEADDQIIKACNDYERAMNLGNAEAQVKAKILCGVSPNNTPKPSSTPTDVVRVVTEDSHNNPSQPSSHPTTGQSTDNQNQTDSPGNISDDEVLSSGTHEDTTTSNDNGFKDPPTPVVDVIDSEPNVQQEGMPKNDHFVNNLVIDEELSIQISGQELGRRKIIEVPSVLILADESGSVTVNICVNKSGVVTKAEFNATLSTIAKKSLVSLAIRKAKEFEFAKGEYDSQCGIMVFKINAG